MGEKFSIHIDESGNTGTNWLDNDQRYFVYGGWIIEDKQKEKVNSLYNEWKSKRQKASEFKSNRIFKSAKGRKEIEEVIYTLIKDRLASPCFIVMEKRFMMAAKVIETFFDAEYNPVLSMQLTQPREIKIKLANVVCNSQTDFLKKFSVLVKGDKVDLVSMKELNKDLVSIFRNENLLDVAEAMSQTTDTGLLKMAEEFQSVTTMKGKNFLSLTVPGIINLYHIMNLFSEFNNVEHSSVYHDKLRGYDNIFDDITTKLFHDGRQLELFGKDGRYMSNNFNKLKFFSWEESKNDNYIQLADFLNGFVQYTFKKSQNFTEVISPLEKKIWKELITFHDEWIIKSDSRFNVWDLKVSYKYRNDFYSLISGYRYSEKNNYIQEINEEFPEYYNG